MQVGDYALQTATFRCGERVAGALRHFFLGKESRGTISVFPRCLCAPSSWIDSANILVLHRPCGGLDSDNVRLLESSLSHQRQPEFAANLACLSWHDANHHKVTAGRMVTSYKSLKGVVRICVWTSQTNPVGKNLSKPTGFLG